MAHTGQCLCGAISYEFQNPPAQTGICHCKNCQRQAGSAYSTLAVVPMAELTINGEPKLYTDADTSSGNPVERYFCGNCGSPIYSAVPSMEGIAILKTGCLDDTSEFKPMFQTWCESKQDWVELGEDVPVMPTS